VAPTFAAAARELRRADVLVCPRGTWSGFPIKVLNYMALGRPIVHDRASAHPLQNGVTALTYADHDARALAQTIVRLVRDPELSNRLARQARAVVREQYTWPRVLPRIVDVYRRVVQSPGATGVAPGKRAQEVEMKRTTSRTVRHRWEGLTRHLPVWLLAGVLAGTGLSCGAKRSDNIAPLPPLAAPPATAGVPEVDALYRIQAYDTLRVKFLYHPELDTRIPVRPDGGINVSGVGDFQAAGKTTTQLAREVEKVSSEYLRDPKVDVIVAELGRYRIWVFGEVRSPGEVPFREGMTPLQAISDRGGFSDYARADSVLRIKPEGSATRVDLTGNLPDTITVVEANEVIYVPRTFVGDAVAFVKTFRNLLPVQPRFGMGYSLD
jgi:polysaccharide export outer membrane protein